MRHRVYGKHFSRSTNERTSLFRSLVGNLILNESLETTETKAKAIKGLVDKVITAGKKNSESSRRIVQKELASNKVVKKLLEEIAPRYPQRMSGFTEIVRLGQRLGDGAMMVKMSLIKGEGNRKVEEKRI